MPDAVENVIRRLNECWLRGDYDGVAKLFDKDAVLLPPRAEKPIVGRTAIVDGYRRFGDMGEIHEFEIVAVDTFVFAATAMCHMRFNIDYAIDARRFRESGVEIYALSRSGEGWEIVWRTQVTTSGDQSS